MPQYRVHELREEVAMRKCFYFVEADSEDDAIEQVMNGQVEAIEQGTIREPEYVTCGWSARPVDSADDSVWDEALADLEARKLM